MHTPEAILFDKAGTLFDYEQTWANWSRRFLRDLASENEPEARRLGAAVGFDIDTGRFAEDSPMVCRTPSEVARVLAPCLPGTDPADIAAALTAQAGDVPQAEVTPLRPLMAELRRRDLVLGVVTNDTEGPTRMHLDQAGIGGAFAHVLACDSGFAPKPAPDMLLAFCDMTGIAPDRTVMVGDSPYDLEAASAAGITGVAVLTGVAGRAQLEPRARAVLGSIAELPQWLTDLARGRSAA